MKYNRIKEVLENSQRFQKWLSDELNVSVISVSNWCQNHKQTSLKSLYRITRVLQCEPTELIQNERKGN